MKKKQKKKAPKRPSYLRQALDQMYDLEQRVGMEFHRPTPALLMACTHGYILAELSEIRCLLDCHERGAK